MVSSQWTGGGSAAVTDKPAEPETSPDSADMEAVEDTIIEVKRAVLATLLNRLAEQGLLSKSTNQKALDLVHLRVDFPPFFRYPVCSTEEAG